MVHQRLPIVGYAVNCGWPADTHTLIHLPECTIADVDSVHLDELYGARTALEIHSGDAYVPCALPEGQKADFPRLVHGIAGMGHVIAASHHGTAGVVRVTREGHASRAHRHTGGDDVHP